MTSRAYDVKLSGNKYDDSVIVHEVTHSFVTSSRQIETVDFSDEYNPIFLLISEINSYVLQLLFYDFF